MQGSPDADDGDCYGEQPGGGFGFWQPLWMTSLLKSQEAHPIPCQQQCGGEVVGCWYAACVVVVVEVVGSQSLGEA